jgi:nucleoside-diphosphate-sugar epimerase
MIDRVIITGAAGLIGQNLTQFLIKNNYDVLAIDKNEHNLRILQEVNPLAQTFVADLSQHGQWEKEFSNAEVVVQLQAQVASLRQSDFVLNNINSVVNVIAASKRYNVKHLIHISSSTVISVANDYYTQTKRAGEELVRRSRLPHTILRPSLLYGCFDTKHLGWLARFLERSPIFPVAGHGRFLRQPVYVQDLCEVILACIKRGPEGTVHNIIGLERIDYIDLVKAISSGKRLRRLFLSLPLPVFTFGLRVYGFLVNRPTFTTAQLTGLIAGDEFPVDPWCSAFGVKYTPFLQGIEETLNSPYYNYGYRMKLPY